jgi:hypothetical protein
LDPNQGRKPDSVDGDGEHGWQRPRPLSSDGMRGSKMWSRHRTHRRRRHDDSDEGRFSYHPPGE